MLKLYSLNHRRKLLSACLWLFLVSSVFPHGGIAGSGAPIKPAATFCACCPDHGMWEQQTKALADFEIEGLATLKFEQKAYLHVTVASPDDIKGLTLSEDDKDEFALTTAQTARRWTLTVKTKNGESGKLILRLPNTATFFHADVTNGPKTWAAPGSVYKEIRLAGLVQGTGIFADSVTAQTKYRLVLQANGGRCFDPAEFHRWNLKVRGAKADFTLYGFFSKAKQ